MVNSKINTKGSHECLIKARLQLLLARIYFVKVWLFYLFVFYFLECFMLIKSELRVAVFET